VHSIIPWISLLHICDQVAYQRILQLTYVDDLLAALKTLFVKLFEPFLVAFVASLHAVNKPAITGASMTTWDFSKAFEGWDAVFNKLLRGLEEKAAEVCADHCCS
jgi:signal recognition particle receptor subunit alpha